MHWTTMTQRERAEALIIAIRDLDEQAEYEGIAFVSEYVQLVEEAFQQIRQETVEEAAKVVEVHELIDPSGLSSHEQRRIYEVLSKAAQAIRQLGDSGGRGEEPRTGVH